MISESTKGIVRSLRTARDERGLTLPDIASRTGISDSTLRRVFLDDIDGISGFSYENTLAPLIEMLLKKGDTTDSALSQTRIEGLLALIAEKDERIAKLSEQALMLQADHADRCRKCADEITFLKRQIALKDERMDKKDEWINQLLDQQTNLLTRLAEKMM